jgi:hypothetical protein
LNLHTASSRLSKVYLLAMLNSVIPEVRFMAAVSMNSIFSWVEGNSLREKVLSLSIA